MSLFIVSIQGGAVGWDALLYVASLSVVLPWRVSTSVEFKINLCASKSLAAMLCGKGLSRS